MSNIPGAPNARTQKYSSSPDSDERNFHHSALTGEDHELTSMECISQMVPYVFVSSWDIATDMVVMREKNIKFMLNMSDAKKDKSILASMAKLGIVHEHIEIDNVPDYVADPSRPNLKSLETAAPAAFGFIKRAVDLKKNVLVHCAQGVSTSPAAVAYYLLKTFYQKMQPSDNKLPLIVHTFRNKRSCVDINFGFLETLEDMEAQLSGRAVQLDASLSVRRNKKMKQQLKENIQQNVVNERQQADRVYGVSTQRKRLI